jgi:uncharacterized protein (TIGR04255 family)
VDEVAVGVQFVLPGFLPTHYGRFHERIKSEFPVVQMLPPLPPQVETFSVPQGPNELVNLQTLLGAWGGVSLPRVLFVSKDDSSLIQLQHDRLYVNWRKRGQSAYPHYDLLREQFSRIYIAFEAFIADEGLGVASPFQCDVFYVNPLPPVATGVQLSFPERVFRCWNVDIGKEWPTQTEDVAFNARYRLLDEAGQPFGRLVATMSSGAADGIEQMRFELTARGAPRALGLAGILAFHDVGHEAIVRCFAAITTPEMHKRWGRYDHE